MQIYLVLFDRNSLELGEKLFSDVKKYIDENYVLDKSLREYDICPSAPSAEAELAPLSFRRNQRLRSLAMEAAPAPAAPAAPKAKKPPLAPQRSTEEDLTELLKKADRGFSETLLSLIDRSGKKDSEVYKRANVDRKLFSKIRNNPSYKPSKSTAVAFALALELNIEETADLLGRAGYALSHSSYFDIIVEYFIVHGNYNIFEINEVLFKFDQSSLGGCG